MRINRLSPFMGNKLLLYRALFLSVIFSLFSVSCSSAQDDELHKSSDNNLSERKMSFYNQEDGETAHYEVLFNDREIVELKRNGQTIPEDEYDDYEDLVRDVLGDLYWDSHTFKPKTFAFRFDTGKFHEQMDSLRKNLDKQKWVFEFDSKQLKENMEKLKEELKDMDFPKPEFDFHFFDNNKFKMYMERLHDDLDDMEPPDLSDLEADMEKLKLEMKDLNKDMEKLDTEMKKLDGFLDDTKSELVKDGYLENNSEEFQMELDMNSMTVNGKDLPDSIVKKYLEIYKKHYGKYPDEKVKIHTD